jgi:hypothetical protein
VVERPLDPDDLPISTQQTDDERRLADALLAAGGYATIGAGVERQLAGAGDPGYQAAGSGVVPGASELLPRRLSLRVITDRVRPRG